MAQRVVITGVRRASHRISAGELHQMMGRAGREHGGASCLVDVVVEEQDEDVFDELETVDGMVVKSCLTRSMSMLCFHVLPEICAGRVRDVGSAEQWFSRAFGCRDGDRPDVEAVFMELDRFGAVEWDGNLIIPTSVGRIASTYYYHPADVSMWCANFDRLFVEDLTRDDRAVAWALGSVSHNTVSGDVSDKEWMLDAFLDELPAGLRLVEGSVVTSMLWWSALGGPPAGKLRYQMKALRDDAGRVCRALTELDRCVGEWGMTGFFMMLRQRLEKGIPSHLFPLWAIRGMTKAGAMALYEMGVRKVEDLDEMLPMLEDGGDPRLIGVVKDAVRELQEASG